MFLIVVALELAIRFEEAPACQVGESKDQMADCDGANDVETDHLWELKLG